MKIAVLGGSGFLGSFVADRLTFLGHKVIIYDKKKSQWLKPNQIFVKGNILDYKSLEKVIKKVKIVYHFAALANLDEALNKPLETVQTNIMGTVNVLELAKKHNLKKIIYASSIYSMSVQGGFYRCSKKAAEDYIEEYYKRYGLNFTILRYGSLYGPRADISNGVFGIVNNAFKKKKLEYYGNRSTIRKYVHIFDAAKATVDSLATKYNNKYVNITGAKSLKVSELFKILSKSLKISSQVKYLNKNNPGHYIKSPKIFKLRTGINYKFKKHMKFENGIKLLINYLKNHKYVSKTFN